MQNIGDGKKYIANLTKFSLPNFSTVIVISSDLINCMNVGVKMVGTLSYSVVAIVGFHPQMVP